MPRTEHPAVVENPVIVHRHRLSQPCNNRCWAVEANEVAALLTEAGVAVRRLPAEQ